MNFFLRPLSIMAGLGVFASLVQADPTFSLTDVGAAPSGTGWGFAGGGYYLNDSGQVAATYSDGGYARPLFWSQSTGQVMLGAFGSYHVFTFGIGNDGTVWGNNVDQAFSWKYGGSMNNFNPIVGSVSTIQSHVDPSNTFYFKAGSNNYIYHAGAYHQVNPQGGGIESTNANADLASYAGHSGHLEAFRWVEGVGTTWLGVPTGYTDSYSFAINGSGVEAGYGRTLGTTEAAVFSPGGIITKLGTFGGSIPSSSAYGINNSGWVVGDSSSASDNFGHGFVWSSDFGLVELQTHLDSSGTGWKIFGGEKINVNGQILAFGSPSGSSVEHLVLLTPVPEPASLSVLALGCLALYRKRRNK